MGERHAPECVDDVIEDEPVARLVACERCVERLDAGVGLRSTRRETRLADEQSMLERAFVRLRFGVDGVANRTQLHLRDGVMPIATLGRCGEADDVPSLHLRQHPLE